MDYYMQAFAPFLTSLSGFLNTLVSFIQVLIGDDEVPVYEGLSAAVYARDTSAAGTYFGTWFQHLWDIELQDSTLGEDVVIYGTMS